MSASWRIANFCLWRIEALHYRVDEFLELSGLRGDPAKATEEYRALVVESYPLRR